MKVRFTVELDAFDAELKDFLTSAVATSLVKTGMKLGKSIDFEKGGLGPALAEMLSNLSTTMVGERGVHGVGREPTDFARWAAEGAPCGIPGPADTVEGSMWEPCSNPVEFVVEHPKFGNRGHVQRVTCAKHKDYIVGGAADARVTRIAPPVPPPPEDQH